jgi:predicted lipoprotein with Yx(FWY)xxD motif
MVERRPRVSRPRRRSAGSGLKVGSAGGLDGVVTNGTGLMLYRFDRDSADPPTSNCDGECAETWPTVLVGTDSCLFFDDGIDRAAVGSIPSGDGAYQLTIGGWPIYRFAEDTRAGQAGGQGVGGTWFAIGPDGTRRPVAAAPPTAVAVAVRALTTPTVLTARTVLGTVVARAATPPTGPPPSRPAVPTRSTAVPAAWVAASA